MLDLSPLRTNEAAFAVLKASAGSGKTFSLVRLFMALCLRQNDPMYFRHILAITFTNKAAFEMKERVLQGMLDASQGKGDHLQPLSEVLGVATSELVQRAGRCHDAMMSNYGLLSVMTIDKFVNRLVRSFSRELAMDSEFRIMLNQKELVAEAVDALMARIGGEDELLTTLIERYALQRLEDEQGWDMRQDLKGFGELLFSEHVVPQLSELDDLPLERFIEVYDALKSEVARERGRLKGWASAGLHVIDTAGIQHDDFSGKNGLVPGFLKRVSDGSLEVPSSTVRLQAIGDRSLYASGTNQTIQSAIDGIADDLRNHLNTIIDYLSGDQARLLRLKVALLGTLYQLAVLKALRDSIKEVREARNIMTFNDMNRLIELLVRDNPAPFIYERLGERYKHYLIDEFQDTSIVQWQNFLPLIEESLSNANYNLIVGDGKQAIYRWRNGDVRQFQKMPEIIGRERTPEMMQREAALRRYQKDNRLEDNWRSLKEVVKFNNALFVSAAQRLPEELQSIYHEPQQNPKGGEGGWVTVRAYNEKTKELTHASRMEYIVELIQQNLQLGYSKRDIAILVRDNKVGGRIARDLLARGIDTVTVESLQLGLHPAPWAVVSLLKWLNNRSDMGAAAWFIQCHRSVKGGEVQHEEDFVALLKQGQDNRNCLDLAAYLRNEVGIENIASLASLSLYDLMMELLGKLDIARRYPAHAEALLELTFGHQKEANEGIPGFLALWESEGIRKSVAIPDTVDGVQVLTVHKSKGLEFPVVIHLVGDPSNQATRSLHPVSLTDEAHGLPVSVVPLSQLSDTTVDADYVEERGRLLLDDLNVVYVGMTRAVRHLHVLIETSPNDSTAAHNAAKITRKVVSEMKDGANPYDSILEFGEAAPLDDETRQKREEKAADELRSRVVLQELVPTKASERLKVSIDSGVKEAAAGKLSSRQFGNELHALLALLGDRNNLEALLQMQWPWQRMDRESWDELLATLNRVVSFERAKSWFEPHNRAWNERELMLENGDTVCPDRIVQVDDHLEVVDYKTGDPSDDHIHQVKLYMEILSRSSDKPVKGYLYYTDRMEVLEV